MPKGNAIEVLARLHGELAMPKCAASQCDGDPCAGGSGDRPIIRLDDTGVASFRMGVFCVCRREMDFAVGPQSGSVEMSGRAE